MLVEFSIPGKSLSLSLFPQGYTIAVEEVVKDVRPASKDTILLSMKNRYNQGTDFGGPYELSWR